MKRSLAPILAMAVALMCAAGCAAGGDKASQPPSAASTAPTQQEGTGDEAKNPIRIGLSTPITGSFAENGIGTQAAVEMAVEEINAKGGINGRLVELEIQDSKSDATQAAQIATMFTEDSSILAEIGDFASGACIAAAPIYQEAGMVQLSPTASNPDYTLQGDCMFSIFGKTTDEGRFIADYLLKKYMGAQNVGVIYVNSDWGAEAYDILSGCCQDNGVNIVASETFFEGEKDFNAILTKVRQTNPDTVMLMMGYDSGAVAIKQIRQMDWDVKVGISGLAYSEQLITLGGADCEGVLSEIGFVIDETNPEMMAFATEFEKRTGFAPNMMMTCAYDAMNMLAQAIENCGDDVDRASVRDALAALEGFEGLTGPKTFNEDRTITQRNFKIVTIQDGAWKVLTDSDYID
ncbi:MAG: ABC transporter substrate-binding protein [Oscillospiraceae bacterium]|nr:ABC transporter substrate-binding protein [Oscillospiraceae bacterium]